ncbi:hypothetical protein VTK26DRAFT_8045 [Humicola hyalothermophila]
MEGEVEAAAVGRRRRLVRGEAAGEVEVAAHQQMPGEEGKAGEEHLTKAREEGVVEQEARWKTVEAEQGARSRKVTGVEAAVQAGPRPLVLGSWLAAQEPGASSMVEGVVPPRPEPLEAAEAVRQACGILLREVEEGQVHGWAAVGVRFAGR